MHNVLEGVIRALRDELLARYTQYCSCEQCRDDVLAYALNHTRPKYVTGSRPLGNAVTAADLALDQSRAELTVIVLEGMRRVAANPRHPPGTVPRAG